MQRAINSEPTVAIAVETRVASSAWGSCGSLNRDCHPAMDNAGSNSITVAGNSGA
ncbi:hypothetical protein D3C74_483630 [compost metagenome]